MIILDYQKKYHQKIIQACALALKAGKAVVYPTDTCYGLAVDANNFTAVKKLYRIKGRSFKKPVSIIPASLAGAKKIVVWNKQADLLAKKFFPGPLTIVSRIKNQESRKGSIKLLSAGTGEIGIRRPKNQVALDLVEKLKQPITTTSANVSGRPECYSLEDLLRQFKNQKAKPDIIINAGRLTRRKPSTIIRVNAGKTIQILRCGPISEKQITSF